MRHHQPSGLRHGIPLLIDPNWSPEQVMAIIELLDDLRERIWSHYEVVLLDKYQSDRITRYDVEISDPPF
jgi:hypothetical protein